ncbi:MAG TPA: hypothetical protein VII53_00320 [Solirubrobacteraceae bacterium]
MSRTRLILLGLLAAVAVSVVATASTSTPASASGSCLTVTKAPAYCVEGVPLENASEKIEGTNGASVLKATIASVTSEVKCGKGKTTGAIEGGAAGTVGKSKTTITFEECKLLKPANCKLTAADEREIKTTVLKGELVLTGTRVEDKLEPKEGAGFAGISIEGKESSCVISHVGEVKTFSVTGSQLCEVDSTNTAAEKETEKHKIICKAAGGSLEIGANPAELEDEATIKLTSVKNWSVKET